jgi:hypothetical protein
MYRKKSTTNPRLEAMLDRRDHLRVHLSLLVDSANRDEVLLAELRSELFDLERQIEVNQPKI